MNPDENVHGIALSNFHLGYLYHKHKEMLGHKTSSAKHDEELNKLLMKSPEDCLIKAI